MEDEFFIGQVEALISKGRQVALRPNPDQYVSEQDRLVPGPFAEWRAQAMALLRSALPEHHTYIVEFSEATTIARPHDPREDHRDAGVGILVALKEDAERGYLAGIRRLVSAEVFSDFLDMAQQLLDSDYHHAAASLGGAVLEDALRRTLSERSLKATGNLESMNQVALDSDLYGPITFRHVKVWIGVRNAADHGNWNDIDAEQVGSMLRDLPRFLGQELGLS